MKTITLSDKECELISNILGQFLDQAKVKTDNAREVMTICKERIKGTQVCICETCTNYISEHGIEEYKVLMSHEREEAKMILVDFNKIYYACQSILNKLNQTTMETKDVLIRDVLIRDVNGISLRSVLALKAFLKSREDKFKKDAAFLPLTKSAIEMMKMIGDTRDESSNYAEAKKNMEKVIELTRKTAPLTLRYTTLLQELETELITYYTPEEIAAAQTELDNQVKEALGE